MANPITIGLKRITDVLRGFYVRNSSGTELAVFDTDGYLYQNGTKITKTAAELNDVATATGETLVDANFTFSGNGAHHDYGSAHADWTLSASEAAETYLQLNGTADAAVNALVPTTIKFYVVTNQCGQAATVKTVAGTGIQIANLKTAIIYCNGTNCQRVTADS